MTYAITAGSQQIIIVGHSHGATKSILYQGQRADPRVGAIILASPEQHGHWNGSLSTAQELVATGRPNALITVFPEEPWYQLAAHNIVSRAQALEQAYTGKQGKPYLSTITCPLLAIYGTGGDVGGEAELVLLRQTARQSRRMDTKLIEGADHVYTGYEVHLAGLIADWIADVV